MSSGLYNFPDARKKQTVRHLFDRCLTVLEIDGGQGRTNLQEADLERIAARRR